MTKTENKIPLCEMMKAAFAKRDLTKGQKVTFARLLLYAGKDGIARPTMDTLAADVGGSVPQVRRDVEFLEARKLICIERKPKRANRYSFPNTIMDDRIKSNTIMDDSIMDDSIMDDSINTIMDDSQKRKEEKKNNSVCVHSMNAPRTHFTPPTLEAVKTYWSNNGLSGMPESFFDHFTSNGWKVSGKTPMKDWEASARNWSRNESKFTQPQPQAQTADEFFNSLRG